MGCEQQGGGGDALLRYPVALLMTVRYMEIAQRGHSVFAIQGRINDLTIHTALKLPPNALEPGESDPMHDPPHYEFQRMLRELLVARYMLAVNELEGIQ